MKITNLSLHIQSDFRIKMTGPRTITLRGNKAITKPDLNAWVAQGKGPHVGQTMQRLGWQLARGPAATVVVDLEGQMGPKSRDLDG